MSAMINQDLNHVNDEFLTKKFANKYLTDARTLRIGNIVSFVGSSSITPNNTSKVLFSRQSINFCIEIPDISTYAGVCFQKLFITNAANILASKYFDAEVEILDNDVVIKKDHKNHGIHQRDGIASINKITNIGGTILIYLGFYNDAGPDSQPRAFSLNFDNITCNKFMDDVNASFYHLANNVFLNCAKI